MGLVRINIEAMQAMIRGMTVAQQDVEALGRRLASRLNDAAWHCQTTTLVWPSLEKVDRVWNLLESQKPMLQRRVDLALLVATGSLSFTGPVLGEVDLTTEQIEGFDRGLAMAERVKNATMTATDWAEVEVAARSGDSDFAAGLFSRVSPEELAAQVVKMSEQFTESMPTNVGVEWEMYRRSGGTLSYEAWVLQGIGASYGAKIEALGSLLGVASRSHPGLSDDYADQIVDLVKQHNSSAPQAMSLILGHGQYGTDFALTITEGIYDYERSITSPGGGAPVMSPDGSRRRDVMAGVMAMLSSNPEASLRFLTDSDTAGDGSVADVEKIEYLFTTRAWKEGYADVVSVWSSALQVAGGPGDVEHADQSVWVQTASVSTAVLGALQSNTGFSAGNVNSQAKLELAEGLAVLLPQIASGACAADGEGCANPGGDPYATVVFYGTGEEWPVVNPGQQSAYLGLLGLAGSTPEGAVVLTQASQNFQAQILAIIEQAAQGNVNMGDQVSLNEFARDGVELIVEVQGWIDGSGVGYTLGEALREDQGIRDTVSGTATGVGAVSTVAGFFPPLGTAIGAIGAMGGVMVTAADVFGIDDLIADGLATHYADAVQQGRQDEASAKAGVQNEWLPTFADQFHDWGIRFNGQDISHQAEEYAEAYKNGSSDAAEWEGTHK